MSFTSLDTLFSNLKLKCGFVFFCVLVLCPNATPRCLNEIRINLKIEWLYLNGRKNIFSIGIDDL